MAKLHKPIRNPIYRTFLRLKCYHQ